ncbi:hypothetical protein GCM10027030_28570 [Luteococcus sediminum]
MTKAGRPRKIKWRGSEPRDQLSSIERADAYWAGHSLAIDMYKTFKASPPSTPTTTPCHIQWVPSLLQVT